MTETYYPIGTSVSWASMAVFPVLTIGLSYLPIVKGKRVPMTRWRWIACAAVMIVGGFGLPLELCAALGCVALGLIFMFQTSVSSKVHVVGRVVFLGFCFALAAFFVGLSSFMTKLVLEDHRVVFTEFGKTGSVPREGLDVHEVVGPRNWWESRSWASWTSFAKNRDLGPSVIGYEWYWGPHGPVLGDSVGNRLADWAGVIPKIQQRN